jgi:nitroreductase
VIHRYHDATKHHFQQYARSLGYLDWASQPNPFRSFRGAPMVALGPAPSAPAPDAGAIGVLADLLRHSLGLSAWKQFGASRWALRVNPSSGNLHPTEAYVIGNWTTASDAPATVAHYAPDRHALEQRCGFDAAVWCGATDGRADVWLIALTSIHWREAWKYGERAFRYCQHDLGHAIAALRIAADFGGRRLTLLPEWSHAEIGSLIGVDRDVDYVEAEREEPACLLALTRGDVPGALRTERARLVDAVRAGVWTGQASQLSEDHVEWTIIDDVARATADPGRSVSDRSVSDRSVSDPSPSLLRGVSDPSPSLLRGVSDPSPTLLRGVSDPSPSLLRGVSDPSPTLLRGVSDPSPTLPRGVSDPSPSLLRPISDPDRTQGSEVRYSRALALQRRSAQHLDARSPITRERFIAMLRAVMPGPHAPWDALWWDARIHLALFVHRVTGLDPGLYLLPRHPAVHDRLRAACDREFLWEIADDALPLMCLMRGDCRALARRLSCDQDIAADGFFSLGMIADFDGSLREHGSSFYRHLFWESGVVGQVLYLESEAAGARGTGIGCFFDDPVHDVLGLSGHAFQSLYHFTVGTPVEDARISTEPAYPR